jgi:SOS-response transcriptional repressor LexA
MEDQEKYARAERLKRARKEFGKFPSGEAAAERFSWGVSAYKAHESGRNGIDSATGRQYARAFKVSYPWLYLNVGDPLDREPQNDAIVLDVLSSVPAGRLSGHDAVWPFDIEKTLTLSGLGDGDWSALLVDGDSMDRIAPNGSVIVFNKRETQPLDGNFYVFRHPDTGEATFKMYGSGNPPRLRPLSNSTHDTIYAPDGVTVFGRVRKIIIDT